MMTEISLGDYEWQMNLTVHSLNKSDFGSYFCSAENALGKAEGAVRLQGKCHHGGSGWHKTVKRIHRVTPALGLTHRVEPDAKYNASQSDHISRSETAKKIINEQKEKQPAPRSPISGCQTRRRRKRRGPRNDPKDGRHHAGRPSHGRTVDGTFSAASLGRPERSEWEKLLDFPKPGGPGAVVIRNDVVSAEKPSDFGYRYCQRCKIFGIIIIIIIVIEITFLLFDRDILIGIISILLC